MSAYLITLFILLISVTVNLFAIIKLFSKNKNSSTELEKNITKILESEFAKNKSEMDKNFLNNKTEMDSRFTNISTQFDSRFNSQLNTLNRQMENTKNSLENRLSDIQQNNEKRISEIRTIVDEKLQNTLRYQTEALSTNLKENRDSFEKQMEGVRNSVENRLKDLQANNEKKLDEMRGVVDEKLQKTIQERFDTSFSNVLEQLNNVTKIASEMANHGKSVVDIQKILADNKLRGNFGEMQLESVLEQVLPTNYEKQFSLKRGSKEKVDFVIKLPDKNADQNILYLPIDSKFPTKNYLDMMEAIKENNNIRLEELKKAFKKDIDDHAKEISEKYIVPPVTTNYAIMFLPAEGLYAEVARVTGLFEEIQRKYKIAIAGPSTILALLNAFQLGFKTLTIEKNAIEIVKTLSKFKKHFLTFNNKISDARNHIDKVSKDFESIEKTTLGIDKTLKSIDTYSIEKDESEKIENSVKTVEINDLFN